MDSLDRGDYDLYRVLPVVRRSWVVACQRAVGQFYVILTQGNDSKWVILYWLSDISVSEWKPVWISIQNVFLCMYTRIWTSYDNAGSTVGSTVIFEAELAQVHIAN